MRVPPHNDEAERAVLGAMLLSRDSRETLADVLASADFHDPTLGRIFAALVALTSEGHPADRLVLLDRLNRNGDAPITMQTILELQVAAPVSGFAGEYATLVARAAAARRGIGVLTEGLEQAWAGDPEAALDTIDTAREVMAAPFEDVAPPVDALDLATEDHDVDWIVRGLLARHESVLFVAEPGSGKTTLLNQIAVSVASGLHPWTRVDIPKVRVLVFDFQDSRGARGRNVQHLRSITGDRLERGWLAYELRIHGIDLTGRADQRWFEAKVAKFAPDVVIAGPLYNMVQGDKGRSKHSEETAQAAGAFLSNLVVRRNCALLIEAHAPHGEELRVRGSKYWEDWAGWGFGLRAGIVQNRRQYDVIRFRGDREVGRQWPTMYVQGHPGWWPWDVPPAYLPADPTKGTEAIF